MPPTPNPHLLLGAWTRDDLRALLARHPVRPLLPSLDSPAWRHAAATELGRKLGPAIRALADAERDAPLPPLTDELYAEYHRSGVRVGFEAVYFARRNRLAHAALARLLAPAGDPAREHLTAAFLAQLEDVFSETSWALPAHVNSAAGNPSGKEPLCIDLFCAETANLLADLLEIFGDTIPAPLRTRMHERLRRDVFENYRDHDFRWLRMTNNWNAVCHQGVLGPALTLSDDVDLLADLLLRARESLPVFLSGFSADGGCSEGPTYWKYGFGWLALLNERLEHRTRGELSLFAGDEFVRAIARFGPATSLADGHLVNFSDCAPSGGLDPAILAYLGERLDDASCRAAAAQNYRHLLRHGPDWDHMRTDFLHLSRWLLRFPEPPPANIAPPADQFFPELAVLVARGVDARGHLWEFAAKAGHNDEQHNHNDCGSFLLNVDGRRLLVEIGTPEYDRGYFDSAKRYTYLAPRSLGHSLPLVNGHEQAAGRHHAARVLAATLTPDRVEFTVDLTACYPAAAACRRLVRRFVFEKAAGRLTLTDDYELAAPGAFASMLICLEPSAPALSSAHETAARVPATTRTTAPAVTAGAASADDIFLGAAPGPVLRVATGGDTRHAGVETCAYRDKAGRPAEVKRLSFVAPRPKARGRVEFVFTLA